VLLAVALFAAVHARSTTQFPRAFADLSRKHTLNVCQGYAFNYTQRYEDWPRSPGTECQDLMQRVFGVPEPSMLQAMRLNLPAVPATSGGALAAIGMCGFAMVDRWFGMKRLSALVPIAALLIIVLVPSYFGPEYRNPDTRQGAGDAAVHAPPPVPVSAGQPGAKFLSNGWAPDM